MDKNVTEQELEEKKLAEVIVIAQHNLDKARDSIRQMDTDIAELYASLDMDDKEGLILWNDATIRSRQMKREFERFVKARKKPYFGRIDFVDPNVRTLESYYIGRVGIAKTTDQPVVIDWRAPIASIYYENHLGNCKYTVSSEGTFEVDLQKKRTYVVENDRLKEFFDSDVVANDDLLTSYLAKNKKAVLGEIIATIQKEQNLIIRRSPKTNMIVQGCAGSGKTTVAMHRISYILYNYEEDFRPEDFYIIGSNKILLNYITSVLPDLDVYGIKQMTMEELFVRLLYEDWDPIQYSIRKLDKTSEVMCCKGTAEWFFDLQEFCERYERKMIPRENVYLGDTQTLLVGQKLIDTYCRDNPNMSMQAKCLMLNEILFSKYENEVQAKKVYFTAAQRKSMERKYATYFGKDEWKGSIFELYQEFCLEQSKKGKVFCCEEDASFDVYDLAALAYLYKRIKEVDQIREASHVVIDEAQDFGMMAYYALHYCLFGCTYTIMGDTSQNIHFGYGLNDWEELRKLILTGTYDSFGVLKKSYRNTIEISDFATEILRHGNFPIYPVEPIVRHGEPVEITDCQTETELYRRTISTILNWKKKGYDTIAVVCRDEQQSRLVWERIQKDTDAQDGTKEEAVFGDGIMVLPVSYTKGLEFDAVLLFDPTEESYPCEDKYVKLLYVAATRALHECVVLHKGDLSALIGTKAPKDKHRMELSAETLTKAKEYERVTYTQKELQEQERIEGAKDMKERSYIGPRRLVVPKTDNAKYGMIKANQAKSVEMKSSGSNAGATKTQIAGRNLSPYAYGTMPMDSNALKPKGHSKEDFSIRWIKKEKKYIELVSSAGILRITPIDADVFRVCFKRGQLESIEQNAWKIEPKAGIKWTIKENRDMAEIYTEKMIVRVEKKNGAVRFLKKDKTFVLSEKLSEPRQMGVHENWIYFDWEKNEKLKSKGILKDDFSALTGKAAYISHGGKQLRMPLLVSGKGYELFFACESTVLCCAIPMYGPYVYCADMDQIDYYFAMGNNPDRLRNI